MNKSIIIGRLTRDPEIKTTPSNVAVATFTLAVDRKFKNAAGERQTDFIPIVAWRTTAEFVGKYCQKGTKLVVCGSIQTRTYDDKEGRKIYVTEIIADEVEFAESKRDGDKKPDANEIEDDDTELPFDL
jgi:single-strand DNA-binding protein